MAKATTESNATMRETLPVAPRNVVLDMTSQTRHFWIVELDPEITLDDLGNRPDIWRTCLQGNFRGERFQVNDVLEMRSATWTAWGVISEIDRERMFLYDIRKANRPQRTMPLFEDERYRVGMSGNRFAVYSKVSNDPNPHGNKLFETIDQARRYIAEQYGTRAA